MAAAYDSIAEKYKGFYKSIQLQFVFCPSFFRYLGNVKDKEVLDLACGEGFFSRLIKERGASRVVGVDISKKMVGLARQQENTNPLGIQYLEYDVKKMPKIGDFDLVSAAFLLHYSKTKPELASMCENIYCNLKKGGRFVALNNNPLNPFFSAKEYGSTITGKEPPKEGDALLVTLFAGGRKLCSFNNYFWEKGTYENALLGAGFKKVKWHNIVASREGIEKLGSKFSETCKGGSGIIVIECNK